jgi:hypothetical protein
MLDFLQGKVDERKLRLFACACCRRIWPLLTNEASRKVVETAERFADGVSAIDELAAAHTVAERLVETLSGVTMWDCGWAVERTSRTERLTTGILEEAAQNAAWSPAGLLEVNAAARLAPDNLTRGGRSAAQRVYARERAAQSQMLRDIFGNPFRLVAVDLTWPAWNDGTVRRIAQAIYDERAFDRMPILADALEDAGCDSADILNHCRSGSEHVRGCWVVDLLLGKS